MVDFEKMHEWETADVHGKLSIINRKLDALLASKPAQLSAPRPAPSGNGATFPNYGRAKNQPVAGAQIGDLEYYAAGCRRTLDDPAKSRWHDKERALLSAIEAEIARQSGGGGPVSHDDPLPSPPFGGGGAEDDVPFAPLDGRVP